ncbi:MAG: hypothetical protein U5N21_04035 [Rhodococcus sp. (in: high G+C Gram-positive bacteria)]|uniref:hypothetical protein n=1 Tax=Rhodococcus sp. TaxID=1831 RepID=UPI002AD86B67|nr:hypothetical protein [Rhodococcus sp. (in: high G+C Gram-positive bacteria)]MDZ7929264.1 hypothetical protein [Rhodococcus sp. (in: high G+C Gram-positive bacteria)]
MSPPGIEIGDLNEPARILIENAQALDSSGDSAPEVPNAGPSTIFVGEAITSLAQAMSELMIASARAADAVQACDENYAAAEDANAAAVVDAGTPSGHR